jgi:uncharacterized membrane protein YeaQ/YmgE (transglycosylase-associated protein family)
LKIIKAALLGLLIGFSATLLHNAFEPFGFILSLLLTYLGVLFVGKSFFYLRYQIIASATWLAVVLRGGTAGVGDELLIYGNTYGNLFLIGGFLTLLVALISGKSYRN